METPLSFSMSMKTSSKVFSASASTPFSEFSSPSCVALSVSPLAAAAGGGGEERRGVGGGGG